MKSRQRIVGTIRWALSLVLAMAGMTTMWARGQFSRVAGSAAAFEEPQEPNLYAVWRPAGAVHAMPLRSRDAGLTCQNLPGLVLPDAGPASRLVLVAGRTLCVQEVTVGGMQSLAPDVTGALAALESADPRARAVAARALGVARPAGVWNALLAALDDHEPAVSQAAADALGRIDDPASVPSLLSALQHPNEPVRLGAARALGTMGIEAAVPPLRAMLLNGHGLEVSVAGKALGRIGSPAALDALLAALADPAPTARWHVAMASLETIGEPAIGPLVEVLKGGDVYARRSAAQALGWIGSPSAVTALEEAMMDPDAGVQSQAAWALGEIGHQAARNPWSETWATILGRLRPLSWLVPALSLTAAGWLAAWHSTIDLRWRQPESATLSSPCRKAVTQARYNGCSSRVHEEA